MKTFIYLIVIFVLLSCSNRRAPVYEWQQKYFAQEKKRSVTIITGYEFENGKYKLSFIDSTYETFNNKGQKISSNGTQFYKYNAQGKVIEEEYCPRSCEIPAKIRYVYDDYNRLLKVINVSKLDSLEYVSEAYTYQNNLLVKKTIGTDSLATTETYTYDNRSRLKTRLTTEFNTFSNKWIKYQETMFYNNNDSLIMRKKQLVGSPEIIISKYVYANNLLSTQRDTTLNPTSLLNKHTVYTINLNQKNFKYNSKGKLIEKISLQPDYKTPYLKWTYEYK